MLSQLFKTKSLSAIFGEAEKPEYKLKRALGPVDLTALGIGAIIGAGIFATVGTAAAGDALRPGAGPALMLSFVITAIVCGFTALCYAEFASMVPISGSAYTYSYATLGEVIAWVIGWDLVIEYAVGNIAVAISWANYFKTLVKGFGITIPDWLSMDYRTAAKIVDAAGVHTVYKAAPHVFGVPVIFNLLAVAIVAVITVVLIWGIRESARFNAVMVGIKILVLTFFVIVGLKWVKPANWTPFAPNGWPGISAGAAIVFFAYIGFDALSTAAEETTNPQRNLPIGILGSLTICTLFYLLVSVVFTGLISYPELRAKLTTEQAEPLTMALQHASKTLDWAVGVVAFGSVIAHTAVLLVFQLGQPRIFFSMSRDGLLPPMFHKVHPRFRTPHIATILTGVFVASFAAVASIDEMVDLTNIGTLFAFIIVCAGIIVLRIRDPGLHRPFRVPSGWLLTLLLYAGFGLGVVFLPLAWAGKLVLLAVGAVTFAIARKHIFPVLGILSCAYLIYYLPPTSWLRFAAWLNLGLVIYVGYGTTHSRLTGRTATDRLAEHDAHTAYAGTWLAIVGAVLLVLTRGLDLVSAASQKHESLITEPSVIAGLGHVFQPGAWLAWSFDLFWFFMIPLALNAGVLCPIIMLRAMRAKGHGVSADHGNLIRTSLSGALLLIIVTLTYFVLVAVHRPP